METGRAWGRGIEWDAFRALLAAEARTAMGREQALSVEPLTHLPAIHEAIEETGQARVALREVGPPPLDTVPDARAVLDRCRLPGSVLDGLELASLIPLMDAAPRLLAWGRSVRGSAPRLAATVEDIPRRPELRDAIAAAVADDGSVKDDATPRLRQIRREIRERRRRLVADLERLLQGSEADRIFADRYVTVRNGRYVLPVRAEARSRFRGIVHDRSQSGQTLFMEPAHLVEANNDLVQLGREEEQETARILGELTEAVRANLDALDLAIDRIGALDGVFARAHLAERLDATAPTVSEERRVDVRAARHPLLVAQRWAADNQGAGEVVPVDLEITPERPVLVITGPNAGGKTIALKTLALLALMAQVGCHVPAEHARLPVLRGIHAIIGDDQSVAENLSTFSAFVRQVRQILEEADEASLVLLDELGAGTDPDEGAALAQAILEELAERGALVMATTHLDPLKAFASTHPRARNASVEFDPATLAPTFRIVYDRPGQSYALAIAARFGLSPDLIARAQAHRNEHAARVSELVARLDEHARAEAERVQAIEQRELESASRLAAAREAEAKATARAREIVERAKADAAALIGDVRRAVSAEWDRLKRAERSRRDLEQTRRRINEVAARISHEESPALADDGHRLVPGADVQAPHLGLRGRIVSVAGDTATVQAGAVTVRVPLRALRTAAAPTAPAVRQASTIQVPEKSGIASELHLLGRTSDEARSLVEQYLDDAFMAGLGTVRLVHGKGTGALRKAVRDLLAAHPLVESFRDGEPSEGGTGATVAALKVS